MMTTYYHKELEFLLTMCSLDIKCMYSASTFTQKVKMEYKQLWILAVSRDLDTMKRVR